MQVDVLGIDLAKRVFRLHGVDRTGRALHRSKVSRGTLLKSITDLSPRLVVMEACSSAQHWARRLKDLGIEAWLISPQYVTPFVKTNKNDRNDAEAIIEAASRPSMRFVSIKIVEQQDPGAASRSATACRTAHGDHQSDSRDPGRTWNRCRQEADILPPGDASSAGQRGRGIHAVLS